MRQLSDGEREAWNEMQRDGAPDWTTLSTRTYSRTKTPVPCSMCRGPIEIGTTYRVLTGIEDGRFISLRYHIICPRDAEE